MPPLGPLGAKAVVLPGLKLVLAGAPILLEVKWPLGLTELLV